MVIYSFKNLTFTYSTKNTPTLNKIDLEIEKGGFYIICGKSGSGKSTLLKLMKKELTPRGKCDGQVLYKNTNVNLLDSRVSAQEIGFLHQDIENGLVCDKVWKELSFGLGNLGYSDDYISARVAEVCEYFGISKWYNKKISDLSGGSKQIVSLAAIMTTNPEVLLLDEPTSMLDPIAKKNFVNLLVRINKELGVTIVVVEHNMENLFEVATKTIVVDDGEVAICTEPLLLPQTLKDKHYAKYIGLTEFAEIFSALGGSGKIPVDIENKRKWLKNCYKDNYNNEKIDSNNGLKTDFSDNTILSAENLYFRYKKNEEDIIKGCNFNLQKGEVVCILGGNGGGKTTFVNLLAKILKPYSGYIKMDKSKKIGLLAQNAKGLFVEDSVQNEMYVTAKLLKKDKSLAEQLMRQFELLHIADSHPYDISGGEVQRLALAKLFLVSPDIIILDEPTQGMDMLNKEYLKNLIFEQKKLGKSIIVVTHDLRFAAEMGDRVGLFFDGKILSLRQAKDFFADNSLYTTESSLLTRDFAKDLYTVQKVVDCINKNTQEELL